METGASANQENFLAANGVEIDNNGEMKVPAVTPEKTVSGITFQAAGVAPSLLSVEKMNENGHAVVFDGDMAYVVNKATREVNLLTRKDGNFVLLLKIPLSEVSEKWVLAGTRSSEFGVPVLRWRVGTVNRKEHG